MMTLKDWLEAVKYQITCTDHDSFNNTKRVLILTYAAAHKKVSSDIYIDRDNQKVLCIDVFDMNSKEAYSLRAQETMNLPKCAYYDDDLQEFVMFKIYSDAEESVFMEHFNRIIK